MYILETTWADNDMQELPPTKLPHDEEAQPTHAHHDTRSERHRAHRVCAIRCVIYDRDTFARANGCCVDFGKEKKVPLKGLDDKSIEQQVTELVQSKV
jgi:hypothetical protein